MAAGVFRYSPNIAVGMAATLILPTLHTDGSQMYEFTLAVDKHEAVNHNKEFVRDGEHGAKVHTNTAEGYFSIVFSIFKRGLVRTHQHMSEQHLARYLND